MTMNKRPETLHGRTVRVKVGCGELVITFNHRSDDRYKVPPLNEIFIRTDFKDDKDDKIMTYCCNNFIEPLGKLLTWIIRRLDNTPEEKLSLVRQLMIKENAGCPKRSVAVNNSCIDAVGRALECYWEGHKIKNGRCFICKTNVDGEKEKSETILK